MSGLLQRLALRALGRPPAIRPIVRPGMFAVRSDASLDADQPPERDSLHLQPDTVAKAQAVATMDAPQNSSLPTSVAGYRQAMELPSSPLVTTARRSSAPVASVVIEDRIQAELPDDEVDPEPRSFVGSSAEALLAPNAESLQAQLTRPLESTQSRTRSSETSAAQPPSGPATSVLAGRAATAWTQQPPRPLSAERRTPGAVQRAPEEITEVHVTIGRIELTAAPTPALPRREPARRRKPQSLEDYLARREASRR